MNYMLEYEDKRPDGNGGQRIDTQEGDFEQPQLRFTLGADYAIDDFTASLALNYVDSFKQDDSVRVQKHVMNKVISFQVKKLLYRMLIRSLPLIQLSVITV